MDPYEREELEIEWQSRYDYWAEIAAEHREDPQALEDEMAMLHEMYGSTPLTAEELEELNEIPF